MTLVLLAGLSAGVLQDTHGNVIAGRSINVYARGTSTPVQVYADSAGSSPTTQPLTTDSSGNVPGYVAGGVSIDIVDVTSGLREQAEPVLAGIVATVLSFGAKGDGTDDTTPTQTAVNTLSAAGGGALVMPAGYTFLLGTITPKSNVTIWAYGATLKLKPAATQPMWYAPTAVSNFHVKGATFAGTGAETQEQQCALLTESTDVSVQDCRVTNWATGCFYLRGCVRASALRNTILTCCVASGYNAFNFVSGGAGSTVPCTDVEAAHNYIDNCAAICIAYVQTGTVSTQAAINVNFHDNNCQSTGTGRPISAEFSATTTLGGLNVRIADNILRQSGTGYALNTTLPATATDPTFVQRVVVADNIVDSAGLGIAVAASYAAVTGNVVKAANNALNISILGTYSATGTSTNASTSITSVTAPAGVANGMPISGTNIASGTYIVSGAGTATWTISKAATGANAGITVYPQLSNVTARSNVFRCPVSPAGAVATISQVRDSDISGNRFMTDAGSTSAFNGVDFTNCSAIDFNENRISRAAHHGVTFTNSDNLAVSRNRIDNCSEQGTGSRGIWFNGTSGTQIASGNLIYDDRTAHVMTFGIFSGDAGFPTNGNIISGAVTAATSGTTTTAGV